VKFARLHWKLVIFFGSVLIVGGLVLFYMDHARHYPETDDAYVQSHIVYVASEVSGKVVELSIENYQPVTKGQMLFEIDPTSYQYALDQARARWKEAGAQELTDLQIISVAQAELAQSEAHQILAAKQAERILPLVKQGLSSLQSGDEVQADLAVANATVKAAEEKLTETRDTLAVQKLQVAAARATFLQAKLNLAHTRVYSPATGTLQNLVLRPGSFVTAGQDLFAIVDNNTWWVEANYKETQLQRVRVGQAVKIVIDLYPDHPFSGRVGYVSLGSGSTFSLLPPENATGNWVKITQRFPVKIFFTPESLDPKYPLRVGASAMVVVDTLSS